MPTDPSPGEAALHRAVSDALFYDWDPIGMSLNADARDEYDRYVPEVYDLVRNAAGAEALVDALHRAETRSMGLTRERGRLYPIAERLASLRAEHLSGDAPG